MSDDPALTAMSMLMFAGVSRLRRMGFALTAGHDLRSR